MLERIIGVFKLDVNTFEEIEHDQSATGQAAAVVAISALLSAFGSSILTVFTGDIVTAIINFFVVIIWAFVGWGIWSGVTLLVGTNLFDGKADMGEMLRVIGFAQAPLMLGVIPCVGQVIGYLWGLAAAFIAIRQGLDFDNENGKALITILIGWVIVAAGYCVVFSVVGGAAAGMGAMTGAGG